MAALGEKRAAMLRQVAVDIEALDEIQEHLPQRVEREGLESVLPRMATVYFDLWGEGPDGWTPAKLEEVIVREIEEHPTTDKLFMEAFFPALMFYISFLEAQGRIRNQKALADRIFKLINGMQEEIRDMQKEIDAMGEELDEEGEGEPVPEAEEQAPLECWAELYAVAEHLRTLKPWNVFAQEEYITIVLPGIDEPLYVSCWKSEVPLYGVTIYPGFDAFIRWRNVENAKDKFEADFAEHERRAMTVFFGDSKDAQPIDRHLMKALDLRFRGKNRWIYFRMYEPGRCVNIPNKRQAELLLETIKNTVMAVKARKRDLTPIEHGQTFLRCYDENEAMWLNSVAEAIPVETLVTTYTVRNEILIKQLSHKPMNPELVIEADAVYLNAPVRDEGRAPFYPRIAALIDGKTGIVMQQYMADPEEAIVEIYIYLLDQLIAAQGRPRQIVVRNQINYDYLEDFCRRLNIQLSIGPLKQTNRFIREISRASL